MTTDDLYFTDEHRVFRETVQRFVRTEVAPHVDAWEAAGGFPRSLYRKCGELGLLGPRLAGVAGSRRLGLLPAAFPGSRRGFGGAEIAPTAAAGFGIIMGHGICSFPPLGAWHSPRCFPGPSRCIDTRAPSCKRR